jgi:hypothetical protein
MSRILAWGGMGVAGVMLSMAAVASAQVPTISGAKLVVIKGTGGEGGRTVFISRDPWIPLPYSVTETVYLEVFVPTPTPEDPGWSDNKFSIGAGVPSYWRYRRKPREAYRFTFPDFEPEPVHRTTKIVIKETANGRYIRWEANFSGLNMRKRLGTVGVRLIYGLHGLRLCALFGPETVVEDRPGRFIAKRAPAGELCHG